MSKMTVIQLLNKIANGEEVPREIKYDTMNYVFRHYDYKEVHGELIDEQSSWLEKIDFYKLNDEVKTIEEDKKIKKISHFDINASKSIKELEDSVNLLNRGITTKINEIIDYLEENK